MQSDPNARTVLVVDDEEPARRLLARLLEKEGYVAATAGDAQEARGCLKERQYAVVLTDMNMPGESGLDLIMDIATESPDTATVMVTGVDDTELATTALDMGAYGYIIKPFEVNEVLISVANALRRRELEIENRLHRQRLEQMVRDRTNELWHTVAELEQTRKNLQLSQEETIQRLSIAAEFRDDETARHIVRMSQYCELLFLAMEDDAQKATMVRVASQMHDVGKIGIPDSILLKPGPLTTEERSIMQRHSEIGYRILSGSQSKLLEVAATIALTHHERIDGTGYPRGLTGEEIPLVGRVAAIADVFDALTSNRIYKKAVSVAKALEVMREGRGAHFDPRLLDLFLGSMDTVLTIRAEHIGL
jgi:cyclic di-GMP phosphodiesterase